MSPTYEKTEEAGNVNKKRAILGGILGLTTLCYMGVSAISVYQGGAAADKPGIVEHGQNSPILVFMFRLLQIVNYVINL